MALSPRLDLRQSQSLVMTPQLQQAIKLLGLSNLEIEAFIGEALEANPLLEAGEATQDGDAAGEQAAAGDGATADELMLQGHGEADAPLDIDADRLDRDRDTGDWSAQPVSAGTEAGPSVEERDGGPTLAEHLEEQAGPASPDAATAFLARYLIGLLDEAGYLAFPLEEIASDLHLAVPAVEDALRVVQSLDPTGVGARSLAECLALQAQEVDRYDPAMAKLIENLELLARGKFTQLKRLCGVDDEDLVEMLGELRSYDPRPGLKFAPAVREPVVPDILLSQSADGGWELALNGATLPRLVVNRGYHLELRQACADKAAKAWLGEKLADANWLVKALDQRQKTILKVAAEIVKQQDAFFRRGVAHLKPLTLRMVAEAIEMHESTVSRATSNKYLQCPRGTFELKYFFTSGVASADGEGAVSAQAVKAQIRALVDAEDPRHVLSDDALVELLRGKGYDLARRTVAKYREAIGIGSSVQRRRQKRLQMAG